MLLGKHWLGVLVMTGGTAKVAYLNLSDGSVKVQKLDPEMVRRFIGGPGMSLRTSITLSSSRGAPRTWQAVPKHT